MQPMQWLPLPTLRRKGFDILLKELGPADALRFLHSYYEGSGNYTEERDAVIGSLTLEQIEAEIKEMKLKGEM